MNPFPRLLQGFFTERLLQQRQASPNTVAGYRDTFRLLLRFAAEKLGNSPTGIALEDLDTAFIAEFLEHLEKDRSNSARTRNTRLAALRSFFRYVALSEPAYVLTCQRVLAIPNKRHERGLVAFLDRPEIEAVLDAPDKSTWLGRRDRALLLVAVQTGLRVSELIALRHRDVVLGVGAHVRCEGKGRKQRATPLREDTASVIQPWLLESAGGPGDPVFPSLRGGLMSRDAVERVVTKHIATARRSCRSLERKKITPHSLRHTAAMELLRAGVDRSVIALWLGHESSETTQIYLHADIELKERALARTAPTNARPSRYKPANQLLEFLETL